MQLKFNLFESTDLSTPHRVHRTLLPAPLQAVVCTALWFMGPVPFRNSVPQSSNLHRGGGLGGEEGGQLRETNVSALQSQFCTPTFPGSSASRKPGLRKEFLSNKVPVVGPLKVFVFEGSWGDHSGASSASDPKSRSVVANVIFTRWDYLGSRPAAQ